MSEREDLPPWIWMERQVGTLLASHPLLANLDTELSANERAIDAELEVGGRTYEARIEQGGWYEPETLARAEEIAERLAALLYERWKELAPPEG